MVPLYILGLLQRFGPQHGYQIKKIIAEQLSDFTQIKLPTIYYHLESMEKQGLVQADQQKPTSRPEKTVYAITDLGVAAFHNNLNDLLEFNYRPVFPGDAVFYFSDYADSEQIRTKLETYIPTLQGIIVSLQQHQNTVLAFIPHEMHAMTNIIFSHHEHHYHAELDWAIAALKRINSEEGVSC